MPTTIQIIGGQNVRWPSRCACCGEEASTFVKVEVVKNSPHGSHVRYIYVPSCKLCEQHYGASAVSQFSPSVVLGSAFFFLGIFVSLGVGNAYRASFGFGVFIVWVAILFLVLSRFDRTREAHTQSMLKPNCSSPNFVQFRRDMGLFKSVDNYIFSNANYALDFSKANRNLEVPKNPDGK
jgi:hypothetical protein